MRKSLVGILLGAGTLVAAALAASQPAFAHPHGGGYGGYDAYYEYCQDPYYARRYWRFCSQFYDDGYYDDGYYDGGYYPGFGLSFHFGDRHRHGFRGSHHHQGHFFGGGHRRHHFGGHQGHRGHSFGGHRGGRGHGHRHGGHRRGGH